MKGGNPAIPCRISRPIEIRSSTSSSSSIICRGKPCSAIPRRSIPSTGKRSRTPTFLRRLVRSRAEPPAISCSDVEPVDAYMNDHRKGRPMLRRAFAIGLLLIAAVVSVEAQWLSHRDPKIPRTADGKPNLTAPAPRFNGKPDMSGVWQAERTSADEYGKGLGPGFAQLQVDFNDVTKHVINVFWGGKPGEEPFTAEGAA